MVPPLLVSLYMLIMLHRIGRHDRALFNICHNRRNAMRVLRDGDGLTRQDYIALRDLLEAQSLTIHEFDSCKTHIFNLRWFIAYMRRAKKLDHKFKETKITNEVIAHLYDEFDASIIYAMLSFTPFLKSEYLLRFLVFAFRALARLGGNYFKAYARHLAELSTWIQDESGNNNGMSIAR